MDNKEKLIQLAQSMNEFQQFMTRCENRFKTEIFDVYLKKRATNKPRRKRGIQKKQPANGDANHGRLNIPQELSSISGDPETDQQLRNIRIPLRSSKRAAAKKATENTSLQLRQTLIEKLRNPGTSSVKFPALNTNSNKDKTNIISLPVTGEIEERSDEVTNCKQNALPQCAVMLERCDNLISMEKGLNNFNGNDSPADIFKIPVIPLKKCKVTLKKDSVSQSGSFFSLNKSGKVASKLQSGGKDLEAQSVLCEHETSASLSVPMDNCIDAIVPHVSVSGSNGFCDGTNIPTVSLDLGKSPALKEQNMKNLAKPQDNPNKCESIVSTQTRPVRTKNRNKKYNEDVFYFGRNSSMNSKVSSVDSMNMSKKNNVPESSSAESNNRRGTKRKSEEDLKNNVKSLKLNESKVDSELNKNEEAIGSVNKQTENTCVIISPVGFNKRVEKQASKSNSGIHESEIVESFIHQSRETESLVKQPSKAELNVLLPSTSEITMKESKKNKAGEVKSGTDRSRTRNIANPLVVPPLIVESPSDKNDVGNLKTHTSPPKPEQRMTRTRTREINKNHAELDKIKSASLLRVKSDNELKPTTGKENKNIGLMTLLSNEKALKITPLSSNILFGSNPSKSVKDNGLKILLSNEKTLKITTPSSDVFSPTPGKSHLKSVGSSHSKNQAPVPTSTAIEKKMEIMKAVSEDTKRKREEKERRILSQKQAMEKEKQEKLAKLKKDNEEKEKARAEIKRAKDEQIRLKKQQTEATLKEAEERRMKEEEAKQAYYKKIEEEKRKLAEERQKQAEEAKKLHEKRLAEKAKDRNVIEAAKLKKILEKQNQYELTPAREDAVPKPLKNENDYGLSDLDSDDSSDDEQHPKKVLPKWAEKAARLGQASIQKKLHCDLVRNFFPLNYSWQVQMNEILTSAGFDNNIRTRRSSAVWNTPNSSNRV